MKILAVSNVSIGYGSPQIQNLVKYLLKLHNNAEALILEPDQPQRISKAEQFKQIFIERIMTNQNPWKEQWKIEYNINCAKRINLLKPEVLILIDIITLPTLELLEYKPKKIIYYSLEMEEYFGVNRINKYLINLIQKKADLIIFPEENRRKHFLKDNPDCKAPTEVVYNSTELKEQEFCRENKNGRILYQGTIDSNLTFADFYYKKSTRKFKIDLFGLIEGDKRGEIEKNLNNVEGNVRYMGYVDGEALSRIRKQYSYGVISWNPINDNFLYAAPNKFFEYISDGVIPIAAPHPQCKKIIERYQCGILMKDWSYKSFYESLETAERLYNTSAYSLMIDNCRQAMKQELNWEAQMEKIKPYLKKF